jgi:hypothetical protein
MTAGKQTKAGTRKSKRLGLQRQTLKDLSVSDRNARALKGAANNGRTRCTGEPSGCN